MIRYAIFFIWITFFFGSHVTAAGQPERNIDVIYSLLDESVDMILKSTNDVKELLFEYNSPVRFKRFENRIIYKLRENGIDIFENKFSETKLNYVLDDVSVSYSDAFRESFFGNYKTERKVKIAGSFILYENGKVSVSEYFNLFTSDTLDYESVPDFNNGFAEGTQKPEVPFFGSLLEPVIALGAVAVAIFLFFTVRSN